MRSDYDQNANRITLKTIRLRSNSGRTLKGLFAEKSIYQADSQKKKWRKISRSDYDQNTLSQKREPEPRKPESRKPEFRKPESQKPESDLRPSVCESEKLESPKKLTHYAQSTRRSSLSRFGGGGFGKALILGQHITRGFRTQIRLPSPPHPRANFLLPRRSFDFEMELAKCFNLAAPARQGW